ncbi:hypothetical protein AB0D10_05480 [Kitasatospora sp. NPDC048545]|uniref:hypothetical protein n=1 Tax=Kitasatospora sp. NPDC048545 TaxID=3157208 RepID=UPI0033D8B672
MATARDRLVNLLDAYRADTVTAALDAYRDEVLAEAAEIASTVVGPLWHLDTIAEVQARLNAAGGDR